MGNLLEIMVLDGANGEGTFEWGQINYPDGQVSISVGRQLYGRTVKIKARMRSFNDLQVIACAVSACREAKCGDIELEIPYVLGGRSDRRFSQYGDHYLKDVICPFINSLKFSCVHILDPHSDVLPALLDRVHVLSADPFYFTVGQHIGKCTVVCPDAGAVRRATNYAAVNAPCPVVYCSKKRDTATGKILSTTVSDPDIIGGNDLVIVDDICDGGATFLSLGRELRALKCRKLYLAVTHGIFSKGFLQLEEIFDHIFCTDSYKPVDNILVKQMKW